MHPNHRVRLRIEVDPLKNGFRNLFLLGWLEWMRLSAVGHEEKQFPKKFAGLQG